MDADAEQSWIADHLHVDRLLVGRVLRPSDDHPHLYLLDIDEQVGYTADYSGEARDLVLQVLNARTKYLQMVSSSRLVATHSLGV